MEAARRGGSLSGLPLLIAEPAAPGCLLLTRAFCRRVCRLPPRASPSPGVLGSIPWTRRGLPCPDHSRAGRCASCGVPFSPLLFSDRSSWLPALRPPDAPSVLMPDCSPGGVAPSSTAQELAGHLYGQILPASGAFPAAYSPRRSPLFPETESCISPHVDLNSRAAVSYLPAAR